MKKWDELTPEERKRHVHQDHCYLREIPISDLSIDPFKLVNRDRLTLAELMGFNLTANDFEAVDCLSPLQLQCMIMFYVDGLTMPEISQALTNQLTCNGKPVHIQEITLNQVRGAIDLGRQRILQKIEKSTNNVEAADNK